MPTSDDIRARLMAAFSPSALDVFDDSARHAGHVGARPEGGTHFTIRIVAERFIGLSRVARHRLVNEALQSLFDEGLHALSIDAKSPQEAA